MKENISKFPVDAVITWVNGNDEKHRNKMSEYLEDKITLSSRSIRMRYDQVDEIEFSVKSIIKNAPFIRNIFIVTDNQTPIFFKENPTLYPNVKIIDHKEIFKGNEKYLPTFNSRSIETKLYKIPDLAEHYIYFNDDFFLLKQIEREDFFINGYPILRGKWFKLDKDVYYKKIKLFFKKSKKNSRVGHKIAQQKGAEILGFDKYFKFHHIPQSFRKSTFENYFNENKSVEIKNISSRFRSNTQFISQSLANHIEIKNGTCVLKLDYQMVYIQNYKKPFFWLKFKLNVLSKKKNKLFLCMQSLDQAPEYKQKFILDWLDKKYQ